MSTPEHDERPKEGSEEERPEARLEETGRRIEEAREAADPEPGLTAPLDHYTEEERRMGPQGVMPGSGPEAERSEAVEQVHDDEEGRAGVRREDGDAGPGPVEAAAAHGEAEDGAEG
jgi:hypothetical protein